MSAERLREAAALMRERARAATPGDWHVANGSIVSDPPDGDGTFQWLLTRRAWPSQFSGQPDTDATHIASWHPTVALAVAAMLETEAEMATNSGPGWATDEAIAVADAYLGTTDA